jgi:hypothetical protein
MPEVGFEPTFPVLWVAQQSIPERKQICGKLIVLAVSLKFFTDCKIKNCILLPNLHFRNHRNWYVYAGRALTKIRKLNVSLNIIFLKYVRTKNLVSGAKEMQVHVFRGNKIHNVYI